MNWDLSLKKEKKKAYDSFPDFNYLGHAGKP